MPQAATDQGQSGAAAGNSGDGAQGAGAGGGDPGAGTGAGGSSGAADWRTGLPDDLRSHTALADIKDVGGLAKSFVNAQSLIGRSVRIPGEDASAEDREAFYQSLTKVPGVARLPDGNDEKAWAQFYTKLGRPETPDKYTVKRPEKLPAGVQYNEAAEKEVREVAHKLGLNSAQLQGLVDWQLGHVVRGAEVADKTAKDAEVELRKEWGAGYDQRMAAAFGLVAKYGDAALLGELKASLSTYPGLARALSKAGLELAEDTMARSGGATLTPTVQEMKEKIAEIRNNRDHPYNHKEKPGHKEAVDRVNEYYRLVYEAEKATGAAA